MTAVQRLLVFVDSAAAARKAASEHAGARIVTDNPLLAHDRRVGVEIEDISRHIRQPEATRLGRAAIDALLALDARLEAAGAAERFGGIGSRLNVTMVLRAVTATLMHRGAMLSRALADHGPGTLVLLGADAPRWQSGDPWRMARFACPHRPLAEHGFFGNRPTGFESVAVEIPQSINETGIDDAILRAALAPPAMLAYEAALRLGLGRWGWRRGIVVGKMAETLRETLPWLAWRGFRIGRFEVPQYASDEAPPFCQPPQPDAWLGEMAAPVLSDHIAATRAFSDIESAAIAAVIGDHLTAGMRSLAATRHSLERALDRAFAGAGRRKALLTSGFYGPLAGQLHALCTARGVTLVDFEHGATTGLAHTSERRIAVSEATTCDALMVSSEAAAQSFSRAHRNGRPQIDIVGLADQTRRMFRRPVQRRWARRRLGLRGGECAVMHVSTLLYGGNIRPGDDSPIESFVFDTERRLLTEVYGRVGKTVLFKPYPAQRFLHHAEYDELFDLPANVRMIEWADFRYVRAAADMIVTTANSSTIGWCVGAGVPLIHLGSSSVHALVDDRLRARFAEAFLCIDLDRVDWPDRLGELLARDRGEIERDWDAKANPRRALVREAISGPTGSTGRRAAAMVARLHG